MFLWTASNARSHCTEQLFEPVKSCTLHAKIGVLYANMHPMGADMAVITSTSESVIKRLAEDVLASTIRTVSTAHLFIPEIVDVGAIVGSVMSYGCRNNR